MASVSDRGHPRRRHRQGGRAGGDRCSNASPRRLAVAIGFRLRDVSLGAPTTTRRPDDGRGRAWDASGVRRDLLRRGRLARRARPHQPVGPAAGDLPGVRPVRQHPPGPAAARACRARCGTRRRETHRLGRRAREHRGRVRRRRRPQPAPARTGQEIAIQTAVFTAEGCERIIRYAFDLALTRKRKKVTSVTKSNAQQYGMVLWDEVFRRVAPDYPDVETEQWLVDAMAARFVLRPETLDVVVARTCSATSCPTSAARSPAAWASPPAPTSNPERRFPSMFEPVHGSAPDIAGKGIANPIGADLERGADARPPRACRTKRGGSCARSRPRPRRHARRPTSAAIETRAEAGTAIVRALG